MKFIYLYMVDGSNWPIDMKHWEELIDAYERFQLQGEIRILELTSPEGGVVILASSRIADFSESTPETRQRARAIRQELLAEAGFREADD